MRTSAAGFFSLANEGNSHDRHFHELNEFYFISRAKAKLLNGGREYYVQESDIACIRAGDEHDVLEVHGDEDLQLSLRTKSVRPTQNWVTFIRHRRRPFRT